MYVVLLKLSAQHVVKNYKSSECLPLVNRI